jgi:excisionase family DNA binding protein
VRRRAIFAFVVREGVFMGTTLSEDEPLTRQERRAALSNKARLHGGLLWTIKRTQHELDCSRRQVYYLLAIGKLEAVRIGPRGIRIRSSSVEALAEETFEPKAMPGLRNQSVEA